MSDPTARNRLDEAASPYLRQHADNPVNWQPWDDQALAAARERDVPIFLSVGYSACHWCHVMAEESFEDEDVAELLNEHFVPVKVDREERPDLDRVYQTVCQQVTGRGGWPLSAWLTPDGDPFYVGTYFPREPSRGRPGFAQLLENVADSWADPEERTEMEKRADQWTGAAKGELEDVPGGDGDPPAEMLDAAASAAVRAADREHGGFGTAGPKFPQPGRVRILLRAADAGDETAREAVEETLDAMASGGLYDHVGGGFHRYATDREWTVPHFEKMLYDNAELPRLYLDGYALTGDERYRTVAEETFRFLERDLRHPDGGFYATLDARSGTPDSRLDGGDPEQEEGAAYVWTPEEVRAAMAAEGGDGTTVPADAGGAEHDQTDADDELLANLACERWGVTPSGNFEGGTTVLTVSASVEDLAAEFDLTERGVEYLLGEARERLLTARDRRPRPHRDEKVLAGWNGLAISAFAAGGLLDEAHAETAADALGFVRERLWDGEGLQRRWKGGDAGIPGYLEDYAFLARGALDTYGVTGDHEHLGFALELARGMRDRFYDADDGTLYFTPVDGEELVARPQESKDQSTPSSLGVALETFERLDGFAPDDGFGDVVEATLSTYAPRVEASPLEHATLALVADERERGGVEVTVAADEWPDDWRDLLAATSLPARTLAPRPPTEDGLQAWLDDLGLPDAPPVWADRAARHGHPTAYACRGFACSPPTDDLSEALDWLAENA
jgi:uncharacterized protein YyaL (SSP411 family)